MKHSALLLFNPSGHAVLHLGTAGWDLGDGHRTRGKRESLDEIIDRILGHSLESFAQYLCLSFDLKTGTTTLEVGFYRPFFLITLGSMLLPPSNAEII